jgi:hypothetical protein
MALPPIPQAPIPKTGAGPAPPPPGQGLRILIWGGLIGGAFMLISLPTVMLVFFGLLPSIVAWIVDRTEQKYATACVFGLNFSGLFPFLLEIWFEDHILDAAMRVLTDVFDLMIIYGAAGFGWMLYMALPPFVTTFLSVMSEHRLTVLKENQANIIEEWGENVASVLDTVEGAAPDIPELQQPPVEAPAG